MRQNILWVALLLLMIIPVYASMPGKPVDRWAAMVIREKVSYLENGRVVGTETLIRYIRICTKRHYHPPGAICADAPRYNCLMNEKDYRLFNGGFDLDLYPGYIKYKKRIILKYWQ